MSRFGWWTPIWKTKSAGKQAMRELVARWPVGSVIEGPDLAMVLYVLSQHRDWEIKQGAGVAEVGVVRYAHAYGANVGLELKRTDGSRIDVSWVTCFDGIRQDRDVKQAARFEVSDQRQRAINTGFCGICGQALRAPLQIDHEPPMTFSVLLDGFMAARGLRWDDVSVMSLDGLHNQFVDRRLAEEWADYHARLAVLRVVHKGCNLSPGRARARGR